MKAFKVGVRAACFWALLPAYTLADVYKCVLPNGDVVFQQIACLAESKQTTIDDSDSRMARKSSPQTKHCTYSGVSYEAVECIPEAKSSPEHRVVPGEQADQDVISRCTAAIVSGINWKDPQSVRIESVDPMTLEKINYNDQEPAYQLPMWVNAKNSFGAYGGKKKYWCYLNQYDKSIIRVERDAYSFLVEGQ